MASVEQAYELMRIIDAAYDSADSKKEIILDLGLMETSLKYANL
jgi:hypothetical protein